MVSIKSNTDDKKEVVLAHTTWNRLLDLALCVNDYLTKLSTWQCEAMEMFVAFAHAIKAKLPPDTVTQRPAHNGAPKNIPLMDYLKCFYELQAICCNENICFVAYVYICFVLKQ